jgi:hypothetical protein
MEKLLELFLGNSVFQGDILNNGDRIGNESLTRIDIYYNNYFE